MMGMEMGVGVEEGKVGGDGDGKGIGGGRWQKG